MSERNLKFFVVFLLLIVSLGFVFAEYTLGTTTHNIETTYEPGEGVSGWISIQFTNESNFTFFNDSEGNAMTLIELINENPSFVYQINSEGNINTTDLQDLYLDDGYFNLPNTAGTYSYQFNFSDTEVFKKNISLVLASADDLNTTLNNKKNNLNNTKTKISEQDLFHQLAINRSLNIDLLEAELNNLSTAYESAYTQAELNAISADLSLVKIPITIVISSTAASLPIFPKSADINLATLTTITNDSYDSENASYYKEAILEWNTENLDTKITFNEFSGVYTNSSQEVIVRIFDLEITKKTALNYTPYLVLPQLTGMLFKQNYSEKQQGNYYYIDLTSDSETFVFSTIQTVSFEDLAFFTAPPITKISIQDLVYEEGEENEEEKAERKKWILFGLVIILLLIVALIVYAVLQAWYKKRYEKYLFSNKNDLYNLANYITNAKRRGLDHSQIQENLKKSRWSSEQIRYALRKYSGKRTGMYELPLGKILEKNKENSEKVQNV